MTRLYIPYILEGYDDDRFFFLKFLDYRDFYFLLVLVLINMVVYY